MKQIVVNYEGLNPKSCGMSFCQLLFKSVCYYFSGYRMAAETARSTLEAAVRNNKEDIGTAFRSETTMMFVCTSCIAVESFFLRK